MSVRGPRGRGRGTGRGRGRGRGKTMLWEWESYTPGPEVYDQLWHIRNAPATVTPFLPTECPIPHAQTRIIDRRQTEGEIQRNLYVVELTHHDGRSSSASRTEIFHVDLSRILEYVSPDELERYENEQFQIEAEAEAVAMRAEAEEIAQRRLKKNARAPGTGKGSRMLKGLGFKTDAPMRARPRGRGRGRGRGGWRGRGAMRFGGLLRDDDLQEELVDVEPDLALHADDKDGQLITGESDSKDDVEEMQTSPGLARSAFVANSALPVSPVASLRRPLGIPIIQRRHSQDTADESELDLVDPDALSMSSTTMQLQLEDDRVAAFSAFDEAEEESDRDRHRSKRRRTESMTSNQRSHPPGPSTRSVPASSPEPEPRFHESITMQPPATVQPRPTTNGSNPPPPPEEDDSSISPLSSEETDLEEYVVEAIIEHYREAGTTYYMVKWQGYENSHDWLPKEDLAGAAELVAEYEEMIRKKKKKKKKKMRR